MNAASHPTYEVLLLFIWNSMVKRNFCWVFSASLQFSICIVSFMAYAIDVAADTIYIYIILISNQRRHRQLKDERVSVLACVVTTPGRMTNVYKEH